MKSQTVVFPLAVPPATPIKKGCDRPRAGLAFDGETGKEPLVTAATAPLAVSVLMCSPMTSSAAARLSSNTAQLGIRRTPIPSRTASLLHICRLAQPTPWQLRVAAKRCVQPRLCYIGVGRSRRRGNADGSADQWKSQAVLFCGSSCRHQLQLCSIRSAEMHMQLRTLSGQLLPLKLVKFIGDLEFPSHICCTGHAFKSWTAARLASYHTKQGGKDSILPARHTDTHHARYEMAHRGHGDLNLGSGGLSAEPVLLRTVSRQSQKYLSPNSPTPGMT